MKRFSLILLGSILLQVAQAETVSSKRITQFSNKQVNVWKTIIYPSSAQQLAMHRHENNRVLIALSDGLLKITNDKGKIHYLQLKKDTAYFLKKDIANELHSDENISNHPVKVMVIELNE
ncbi:MULTISPECIES: cupin domain-containing protein [Legionella]|uniref:Cupin domain-containing protein n=1 Tax=Legionella septentrionalis TaxID=2498109 RepID=A0A433JHV9_9GAMM|nr:MULTISPECIES: hypothetical protein [Legionella]MCP0913668.1 hypothetical protein [Legionella sp. 27cVA30]RUQ84449.1 hypothetical protein EKM59_08730 [Legionella septentrionalis]RUQ94649.1 hypothetical protein ELY11_10765 [Legionella septentrionalis]RUR09252.1 hypothetical protein ELY14_09235 [Legionella septentrionalis]RUR14480.1 hypothetical protein ELY10_08585 [Legionella septentrionalis]